MKVLLNATQAEIKGLGGDFRIYRDWLRLNMPGVSISLAPPLPQRRYWRRLRAGLEKLCRSWMPPAARRSLLLVSRFIYLDPAAAASADVILSHIWLPWYRAPRKPVIWSSQGISQREYYAYYNRGQWNLEDVESIYGRLGRRVDALLIATRFGAANILRCCPELEPRIRVIPPPVFADLSGAASRKPSQDDGVIRLLFVGKDAVRKGLPQVLEACEPLLHENTGLRLDIVSQPPPALVRRLGRLPRTSWHPSSPSVDVARLMAEADIFVLPTQADTYALATIEAAAHGCAVVTSDRQPLPEVIPEAAGFCVPPGDSRRLLLILRDLVTDLSLLRARQSGALAHWEASHHPERVGRQLRVWLEEVAG